jgi:hypothetical protein
MKNSLPKLRPAILLLLALLLPILHAGAQPASDAPEMADALRHDGKIYVVISLDRKVSRLEQELKD